MADTETDMENTQEAAAEFASSMRGQLIVSQALHYGIKALEQVEPKLREESNLNDMKYLYNELYPLFAAVAETELSAGGDPDMYTSLNQALKGVFTSEGEDPIIIDGVQREIEREMSDFLGSMREGGSVNMFAAVPHLMEEFDLTKADAVAVLSGWMKSFEDVGFTEPSENGEDE